MHDLIRRQAHGRIATSIRHSQIDQIQLHHLTDIGYEIQFEISTFRKKIQRPEIRESLVAKTMRLDLQSFVVLCSMLFWDCLARWTTMIRCDYAWRTNSLMADSQLMVSTLCCSRGIFQIGSMLCC
ncbi:hypothetical protein MRB53_041243 [Persea americana]|nr:hypothetical protein MRB53_041243 [Persea americana]